MSTPGSGADGPGDPPAPPHRDVVRPLAPAPPDAPADPDADARRHRVIRPLGAPAGPPGPAPPTSPVIRRLDQAPAPAALERQAGSIIRPLAPLPPNMPGSRDRKTGIIRPLLALPPLPGTSPEELRRRREQRDARLAAILRPLQALPAAEAPTAPAPVDNYLRVLRRLAPLPPPPVEIPQIYCQRCESANRATLMFCLNCGAALPASKELYETLTHEYENMQSAERPKSEIVPLLANGRRGPNWQAYGLSDAGRVRKNNEDSLLADPLPGNGWLLVVADGMGGAEAGEVASSQAAEIVRELIENRMALDADPDTDHRPWLMQALEQANSLLYRQSEDNPQLHGMGTTTTAGLVQGLCLELGHVGDSRCYRLPADGPLQQLTTDHAIVAHLLRLGQITPDEAVDHPLRNQLYRAVATAATVEVDATLHILAPTDKLLFCSDGLPLHLSDDDIEAILRRSTTPQDACRALVDLTLNRGAGDNVSVIVLMAG